jgi:hypothetical protein
VTPGLRRLYAPRRVEVEVDSDGVPSGVNGVAVTAVREEWKVDDRWWTPKSLHRRYFELAMGDGRSLVVFRCERTGRWYRQRA